MSYTPPAGDAADLKLHGSYTPPAGDAADLTLLSANIATGFSSTQFGTPAASVDHTGQATGFTSTQFGTSLGIADRIEQATGFTSTQFGSPASTRQEQATGFTSTQFGTPQTLPWAVGFSSTQFGTPVSHRTELATGIYLPAVASTILGDETGASGPPYPAITDYPPAYWVGTADAQLVDGVWKAVGTYPSIPQYFYLYIAGDVGDTIYGQPNNPHHEMRIRAIVRPHPQYPASIAQELRVFVAWASDQSWTTYYERTFRYNQNNFATDRRIIDIGAYDELGLDEYDSLVLSDTGVWPAGGVSHEIIFELRSGSITFIVDGVTLGVLNGITPSTLPYQSEFMLSVSMLEVESMEVMSIPSGTDGIGLTQLGAPDSRHWWRASSMGEVTRFGTPTTPHDVTEIATGFRTGGVGRPVLLPGGLPDHEYVSADGFRSTQFGTPAAVRDETGEATGLSSTNFGAPATAVTTQAQGTTTTQFGTPVAANRASASGFRSTQFGAATSTRIERAAGFSKTRVGKPRAYDIGGHRTYGFCPTKFGRPRGRDSIGGTATGLCTTQFGTPSVAETHLVDALPPVTSFGKPTLIRQPLC